MNKLTFEQLPEAITLLLEKVNKIEAMLSQGIQDGIIVKEVLTAKEAAELMDIQFPAFIK